MNRPRCILCNTETPPLIPLAGNPDRPIYACPGCHQVRNELHYVADGPWPAGCTICGDSIETGQVVTQGTRGWQHADHGPELADSMSGDIPYLDGRDAQ